MIGAFYLIRRPCSRRLAASTSASSSYLEDLDLSRRVHDAGASVYYLAGARAFHKGGGTSEQVKARRLCIPLSSRLLYAFKHFRGGGARTVAAATLLVEPFPRLARGAAAPVRSRGGRRCRLRPALGRAPGAVRGRRIAP